jgi:uncharacterized protein
MKTNFLMRFLVLFLFLLVVVAGCKTAPPKSEIGYNYTVLTGDTLDAVASEYRKQGVDVTVDQIMTANPILKATTNIQAGVQLFIPDSKRANLEDLKTKASHGDAVAECTIGVMYKQGNGVSQDYVQAAHWFQQAAKHGQGDAQFCLGQLYQHGQGVKKDPAQAAKWFLKSARQGYGQAQYYIGRKYDDGDGVPKNSTNAAKWYGEAAGEGVPMAQLYLGMMCYTGNGVSQDRAQAVRWVRKAAVKGLAEAQVMLGLMYREGDGIEEDDAESCKWLNKAADQGIADAQSALGEMFRDGAGVVKDPVQSYKWFTLAAGNGDESAKTNLPAIESKLSAQELSQARMLVSDFKPFMTNSADGSWSSDQSFSLKPEYETATGFFVTEDGYLVTNFHVVKEAGEIFLITPAGTVPAAVVKVDEASDLALLKASGQFSVLPVADGHQEKLGSPVMTVGFPDPSLLGFSAKFSRGDIAGLTGVEDDPVCFQISVPIQPGNSGGALLDGCGNVVGIVSRGIDKKQALDCNGNVLENVNYAVKSQYLLRLLASVPDIGPKLKPPGTEEKKSEDIATSAEKASVMILIYGMKL